MCTLRKKGENQQIINFCREKSPSDSKVGVWKGEEGVMGAGEGGMVLGHDEVRKEL